MRITGGIWRGRLLDAPPGRDTRPTSDRVKEALFAIISAYTDDAVVLDLYAGTGALALEALSRGARRAVLVEKSNKSAGIIQKNIQTLDAGQQARLIVTDAMAALRRLAHEGERFSLILLDPPYFKGLADIALERIAELGLFTPDALAVLEFAWQLGVNPVKGWRMKDQRRYGDTGIAFYVPDSLGDDADSDSGEEPLL